MYSEIDELFEYYDIGDEEEYISVNSRNYSNGNKHLADGDRAVIQVAMEEYSDIFRKL